MFNKKQIDNLAKYCYDVSKLVMGLMVIGNLIPDKFSMHTIGIGLVGACGFLIMGFLFDRMEVNSNVKH